MATRRDFAKLLLATGALLGGGLLGCGRKRREPRDLAPTQTRSRPRYWVQLLLSGGHDTLFTIDAKTPREVDASVTLPLDNSITDAGSLRLGPHFAPLARWADQLAIVNGIQVRTVNHDTAQKQFFHLKTNIADGLPSALDVIAGDRDGQPLGVAYLNLSARVMHSPAFFGTADEFFYGHGNVFDQVAAATPDELTVAAAALRRQAAALNGRVAGWREAEHTQRYLTEVASFFERVATVPPLVVAERSTDYVAQAMASALQRTVWLLEHDLCSGVIVDLGVMGWDSHLRNDSKQTEMNGNFVRFFSDYLTQLAARKNEHGVLADTTLTIVGSELGRFPKQNAMLGKDHFPQTSLMLLGPGVRTGRAFGRTGRQLEGLSIDYRTGEPAAAGRVPVLDDIGVTVLRLAGLDPELYGYAGRACEFLLA